MQNQVIHTSVIEITSIVSRSSKTITVELEPGTILILTMDQDLLNRTAKLDVKQAKAPEANEPAKVQ